MLMTTVVGRVFSKVEAKEIISENLSEGYYFDDACQFGDNKLCDEAQWCVDYFMCLCADGWDAFEALECAFDC